MKVRASIAASILENPEILEEVYAQASDAAGSAETELGIFMDSTQAKINQFNNAVQQVWAATINSDIINFFVEVGTSAAEMVANMGGLIPVITGIATAIMSLTKNTGLFSTIQDEKTGKNTGLSFLGADVSAISNSIKNRFSGGQQETPTYDTTAVKNYNNVITGLNSKLITQAQAQREVATIMKGTDSATQDLIKSANGEVVAVEESAHATENLGIASTVTSVAIGALKTALNTIVGIAIGAAISKLIQVFYDLTHQVEKAREAADAAYNDYQSLQNKVSDLKDELQGVNDKIDALNRQQTLSFTDEHDMANLREQKALLERELEIQEALAKLAGKEANKKAQDYFNTSERTTETEPSNTGTHRNEETETYRYQTKTPIEIGNDQLSKWEEYNDELDKAKQKQDDILHGRVKGEEKGGTLWQSLENDITDYSNKIDELEPKIYSTTDEIVNAAKGLSRDDEDNAQIFEDYDNYIDRFNQDMTDAFSTLDDTFDEVFDMPRFEGVKEELISLAEEGTVRTAMLTGQYQDLLDVMLQLGLTVPQLNQYLAGQTGPSVDIGATRDQLQNQLMNQAQSQVTSGLEGMGTIERRVQLEINTEEFNQQAQMITNWIDTLSDEDLEIIASIMESGRGKNWTLKDWQKELDKVRKDANKGINVKITVSNVSDIKGASDDISTLKSAYDDFKEDMSKGVSLKNIDTIINTFSDLEGMKGPLDDFVKTVTDAGASTDEQLGAFNQLLNAYLDASGLMEQMNGENGEYIQAQLEAAGVELQRCEALSEEQIALIDNATAGEGLLETTANLQAMTWEDIEALAEEIGVTDETSAAFYSYMYAKLSAAGVNFDTSSDIGQLAQVCEALGAGAQAWANYYAARAQADAYAARADAARARGRSTEAELLDKAAEKTLKDAGALAADATSKINSAKLAPVGTKTGGGGGGGGGGGSPSGGGGGGSGSEPSESEFDLIQRRLEILDKQREDLLNRGESSYLAYFGLTEDEINRAVEILNNADAATADSLEELAIMAQNAGMSLQEFFEAMSTVGNYSSRESNLYLAIQVDTEGIELATQAVEQYDQIAEEALSKLSAEQQEWVKKGDMQVLTLIGDEGDAFQEALDAWDQRQDAIDDLNQRYIDYLEDTQEYYDLQNDSLEKDIDLLETRNSLLDTAVSYAESAGQIVDPSLYSSMIANSQSEQAKYRKQIKNRQEELEALIDPLSGNILNTELYRDIQAEIMELESNLAQCAVDQADWNYEITQIPINLMQQVTDLYQQMSTQLQNWGAEEEAAGRKLDADYYQSLIQNGLEVIDQLQRQKDLLEDVMDETDYAVGSDKWYEVYSALQDVNGEISSMVQNLYEWNQALIDMPLESISGASSELEMVRDALQSVQDDYDTVITAVTTAIQNYRDDLEKELEDQQDEMQDEIDALQDRLDLLNKQNEALKYQTALEQALYDLEVATTQKTQRVNIIARTYSNVRALKCA